jgi:hypothetical protein
MKAANLFQTTGSQNMKIRNDHSPHQLDATPQQALFAALCTTTDNTLVENYRLAYPARGSRQPATERRAASRLAHHPRVLRAIERARQLGQSSMVRALERAALLDPVQMKREALITLGRVERGELDLRCAKAARSRLREADRQLRKHELRAQNAARDLIQRQREDASRRFFRAMQQLAESRRNGGPPLSHEERVALIFQKLAPIAPPEPLPASPVPAAPPPPDPGQLNELWEHVHVRQQALEQERHQTGPQSFAGPSATEENTATARPYEPAPAAPNPAADETAEDGWVWRAVPGHHPPKWRWVRVSLLSHEEEDHV